MKIPNRVKIIWWFLLAGFLAYLLSQRYDSIISGATSATDIVIFLIFIALLSTPLFQEVDFFGVRLKREIDTLRTEFKEQIINLRSDIQNTINMRTEISPHIYLAPPSDSELRSIEERIRPILEQTLKQLGIEKPAPKIEEIVPDDTQFLFSVRYAIENELKRIAKWLWIPQERRYRTALQIANDLLQRGAIVPASVELIREVFAICSSAIHGEDVTETSVKFVKDASSPLLAYLKSIEEQPPGWQPINPQSTRNWEPRYWTLPPEEHPH